MYNIALQSDMITNSLGTKWLLDDFADFLIPVQIALVQVFGVYVLRVVFTANLTQGFEYLKFYYWHQEIPVGQKITRDNT